MEEQLERWGISVHGYLVRCGLGRPDETFLEIMACLRQGENREALYPLTLASRAVRGQRRQGVEELIDSGPRSGGTAFERALAGLPPAWREAVILADLEGLVPHEAASVMEIPLPRAVEALREGRRALAEGLAGVGQADREPCRSIANKLLDRGVRALREATDELDHVADCPGCYHRLNGMALLEEAMARLEPLPPPPELWQRALAPPDAVVREEEPAASPRRRGFWEMFLWAKGRLWPSRRWARWALGGGVSLMAALLLLASLFTMTMRSAQMAPPPSFFVANPSVVVGPVPAAPLAPEASGESDKQDWLVDRKRAQPPNGPPLAKRKAKEESKVGTRAMVTDIEVTRGSGGSMVEMEEESDDDGTEEEKPRPVRRDLAAARIVPQIENGKLAGLKVSSLPAGGEMERMGLKGGDVILSINGMDVNVPDKALAAVAPTSKSMAMEVRRGKRVIRLESITVMGRGEGEELAEEGRFWERRASLEGLTYKEATGYWANTYVPGDHELRHLHARMAGWEGSAVAGALGRKVQPHESSRRASQPFDRPQNAALAAYLHADRTAVEGPTRLLVQVGIQATQRRGGARPSMNMGVVLDLRHAVAPEDQAAMRALMESLARACQAGDRFSLTVAGPSGGLIVPPEQFRFGAVAMAMRQILGGEGQGSALGLLEAVDLARGQAAQEGELGTGAVLVVTAAPWGDEMEALAMAAHRSAVDGVPVSVVAVGQGVDLAQVDRLVLAGQGNRRLLARPADAVDLVERELSAQSRMVAKAVRLRIRLAPGVRLVDVVGSYRLDDDQAERVREAERSIDQRISRNLGIQADRGDDEEGIQIVIPSFFAGDSHVVLLDVVAERPGPVADVTVRYKDLVYLRNGVARATLGLGRVEQAGGALEVGVLKSYLAHDLSQALRKAGQALAEGQGGQAGALVAKAYGLRQELSQTVPLLARDPDMVADLHMLKEYIDLLGTSQASGPLLADSLRYAGLLKVLPVPH